MKYIIIAVTMFGGLLLSCQNWIDISPEGQRTSQEYWESEDDIRNTVINSYVRMRKCVDLMVKWGELRADVLSYGASNDAQLISQQNITSDNPLVKWNTFYSVINTANSVIQYAPLVLERDPLLTQRSLEEYQAEAKTVRAIMYFYLVRTFGEVPLITDAYLTDVQPLVSPKNTEQEIMTQIILDLQWSIKRLRLSYSSNDLHWTNKCRVTRRAAQMLLADVYLWNEQYDNCIELCNNVFNSKLFELVALNSSGGGSEDEDEEKWYDNFYPGLTIESVWEIYFDAELKQTNTLFAEFNADNKYKVRENVVELFDDSDVRGEKNSFQEGRKVWKYLGNKNDGKSLRPTKEHSPNWKFYRYAELYFIYAEAIAMRTPILSSIESEAIADALNTIRMRAEISTIDAAELLMLSQEDLMKLILEEKMKEFIGEGKRWYDLVRLAKKQNYTLYKNMVIDILLENIPLAERAIYKTKLSHNQSLYLPIFKDEIDLGQGVLVQNPAYQ